MKLRTIALAHFKGRQAIIGEFLPLKFLTGAKKIGSPAAPFSSASGVTLSVVYLKDLLL